MKARLVLLIGSLVAALGMAEVAARILVPDPYLAFENRIEMFVEDAHAGYWNRPDYRGYAQGTIRVRTNNLGFRGDEIAVDRPADVYRVLAIGDSVTWGVGVQEEDAYPHVLERQLQAADGARRNVEVVNAGVVGYSLHQELLLLEHRGLPLRPDLALVGFTLNDAYPSEDPFFNIHRFHQPARPSVRRREYAAMPEPASYLYRWTRSVARRVREQWEAEQLPASSAPPVVWAPGSFEATAWPVLRQHFLRMSDLAASRGFRLLVLIFPTATQMTTAGPDGTGPQGQIREFLGSAGIAHVDLFDTLNGGPADLFMDNMHLTAAGHQRVADRVAAELSARQWLTR